VKNKFLVNEFRLFGGVETACPVNVAEMDVLNRQIIQLQLD